MLIYIGFGINYGYLMIKSFPNFTTLDIGVKHEIKYFCADFQPYSDFDFTSLWCWNTDDSTAVSFLNDNLIIKLPDYTSGQQIHSILGSNQLDESIITLLNDVSSLELVPEIVLESLVSPSKFIFQESPEHFDYIYSLTDHATLEGHGFKNKRKQLSRFTHDFPRAQCFTADIHAASTKDIVMNISNAWTIDNEITPGEASQERKAIERLFTPSELGEIYIHIAILDGNPGGFAITEKLTDEFAIYHFQKTLKRYKYLDIFLTKETSAFLVSKGLLRINWEQDLGIEGLRMAKSNYRPIDMLKKYSVKLNNV